ncbi:MAG: DeoR/GlpR family DNA-binding transcription regulator [Lachnospiraceae bacterium]|nr:DeoR/GlpR family DNA-binding transcription regulator [Lachnospiraceae bacterium]
MFIEERKEKIVKFIEDKNAVTVDELCELFNVSEVTVRKDLNELSNAGLIIRTHGGAVKVKETAFEQSQKSKENESVKEKKLIAERAYEEIKDNETMILDAGTTTQELAKKIKSGPKTNLTVITNAFNIANELLGCEKVELIFVGGTVRAQILSCVGMFAEEALKNIHVDRAFLGVNNLSAEHGLTTPNMQECKVKKCMLDAARKKYVLADSSKFKTSSLYCISDFKELNLIITDNGVEESYRKKINERGGHIAVVTVK